MTTITKDKAKSAGLSKKTKDTIFIIGMLALPVLHFFVFYVYVNINSILMAFQLPTDGVKLIWSLENFKTIFVEFAQSNSLILSALKNTLIFFFSGLLITLPLSILMCYFFYIRE